MSKHAPRGPVKGRDPMSPSDPMSTHVGGDTLNGRQRCSARSKQKGTQCGRTAIPGGTVCRYHGGAAPQVQAAAQERLKAMQPLALDTLEALMRRDQYPTVQFQASKAVIDWTEGKAAELVTVNMNASVREMTDEELKAKALELAGGVIAGGE